MASTARHGFRDFRKRLVSREQLLGTFVKFPTPQATEILGGLGFDFVVFDQEHAPLGPETLDIMILAARAADIAGIVRVRDPSASGILSVLDSGAAGVLVPHIDTAAKAEAIVAACRYRTGHRGFATTTRAGGYGRLSYDDHMDAQDREIVCIAMIEDITALKEIDKIVRTPGLDAIFIGRGDLTASIGAPSMTSDETHEVVAPIMAAARAADMPVIMLCPTRADAEKMTALGASAYLIGSDHSFMAKAAKEALDMLAAPIEPQSSD